MKKSSETRFKLHPELPQAFLAKPYNLKALHAAISQTLERKKK